MSFPLPTMAARATPANGDVLRIDAPADSKSCTAKVQVKLGGGGAITIAPTLIVNDRTDLATTDGVAVLYTSPGSASTSSANITANGVYLFDISGSSLLLTVSGIAGTPKLVWEVFTGSGSSGGGSGASTIADGADVTQGAIADAAVVGDNTGTLSAKFRGLSKILNDVWDSVNHLFHFNVKQVGGTAISANAGNTDAGTIRVVTAADGPLNTAIGATGDAAVTTSVAGSISAKLRGLISLLATVTFKAASTAAVDADPALVIRSSVLGDRADAASGVTAGTSSLRALTQQEVITLEAVRAALVDATANSRVNQAQFGTNRHTVEISGTITPANTTEQLVTMAVSVDGAAPSSVTTWAPPAGTILVFDGGSVWEQVANGNTTSTQGKLRFRSNVAGATIVSSQIIQTVVIAGLATNPTSGYALGASAAIQQGRQLICDGTLSLGITIELGFRAVTTADPAFGWSILFYYYTPFA